MQYTCGRLDKEGPPRAPQVVRQSRKGRLPTAIEPLYGNLISDA